MDARVQLRLEILRLTDAGYVPEQEPDGWQRSAVFGRSFRLTQQEDRKGLSAVLPGPPGGVVVAGEGGVRIIPLDQGS